MQGENRQVVSNDRKVYIGDLTFDGEADQKRIIDIIKSSFKNPDAVTNVEPKQNPSKQGTYYAFVTFGSAEEAKKAISDEHITINRNTVRVEKYLPRNQHQIYIKDVKKLTQANVQEALTKFGKIAGVHFYPHSVETGQACVVKFQQDAHAEACLKQHEVVFNGVTLKIQKNSREPGHHQQGRQLFLRKIPLDTDKKQLEARLTKQLERFGRLSKPLEIENKDNSGKGYGTALFTYVDQSSNQKAIRDFNKALLGNEQLDLDYYKNKTQRDSNNKIYICNIKPNIPVSQIVKKLGAFGTIEHHNLFQSMSSMSKGAQLRGDITFDNKESPIEIMINAKNPEIAELFINNEPRITPYLDKSQRLAFNKTKKPNNRVNPGYGVYPPNMQPVMPIMGSMGSMGMGHMGPLPMQMGQMPMMGPMNMPMSMPPGGMPMMFHHPMMTQPSMMPPRMNVPSQRK